MSTAMITRSPRPYETTARDMRVAPELTISRIDDRSADDVPVSEVYVSGQATGKCIPGADLEAAIEHDGRYLLFVTDDCPFEDMLRILLLDAACNILDSAMLGAPYSTGSFSSLSLDAPDKVRFRFIGDCEWTVTLLPRAGFRLPYLSGQKGVWRGFGFTRHFIVSGCPKPGP